MKTLIVLFVLTLTVLSGCVKEEEEYKYIYTLESIKVGNLDYNWYLIQHDISGESRILFEGENIEEEYDPETRWGRFYFENRIEGKLIKFKLTITDTTHLRVSTHPKYGGIYIRVPGEYKFQTW